MPNRGRSFSQAEILSSVKNLIPALEGPLRGTWSTMASSIFAFVGGVLVVILVEVLLLVVVVLWSLEKKQQRPASPDSSLVPVDVPEKSVHYTLQGEVWVAALPPGDVRKMYTKREKALKEKGLKEQRAEEDKQKKDKDVLKGYTHVAPVWRFARLEGRVLHLSCRGVEETILLEGCEISAVSSSPQPNRKWAKRYPLKLHNQSRHVYGGSYDCLLYLETGWEKEAWCGVLRASARWNEDTADWYVNMKKEYENYTRRVEDQFPFLNRGTFPRLVEQVVRNHKAEIAAANTKKRQLWKKITRRSMKEKKDNKSGEEGRTALSDDTEEGSSVGSRIASPPRDLKIPRTGSLNELSGRESAGMVDNQRLGRSSSIQPKLEVPSASARIDVSDPGQSKDMEQSLFCGNLLFARIFFDLYHSDEVAARLRRLVQRQLDKLSPPSYIGKINCTQFDLGDSPPLAQSVRSLRLESGGGWGLEADVQYYGGAVLTIETRIDMRDSNARGVTSQNAVVQGLEQTLAGTATADLLNKGLENLKTDFHIAEEEGGTTSDQRSSGVSSTSTRAADIRVLDEGARKGWMQSPFTNVKAMMSRVAEHVSQVPIALTVRVTQLKGTLQLRVKPPPTDRVWFSFTEMPVLDLVPEACIGERRINNAPLGAFIVNQLKVLIKDSMVSPQCEDLPYSWMVSESKNWIPREQLPLQFTPDRVQSDQSTKKERRETQMRRALSIDSKTLEAAGMGPAKSVAGTSSQSNFEDFGPSHSSLPRVGVPSPSHSSLPRVSVPTPSHSSLPRVSVPSVSLDIESLTQDDLTRPLLDQVSNDAGLEDTEEEPESTVVSVAEPLPQALSSSDSDTGYLKPDEKTILETQSSLRRRDKVFTFGKKMGTRLDAKRRQVVDRIRERERDRERDQSQKGSKRLAV